jgi:hypothetical protein
LIGLIGPIIALILYLANRRDTELSFGLISEAQLLDLSDSPVEGVQVLYRGESVGELTAATYHIENSGDLPIPARDFENPLIVKFTADARLLSLNVSAAEPENLRPSVTKIEGGFSVEPLLLNPGDSFNVSAYFAGKPTPPVLDARVAGIHKAKNIEAPMPKDYAGGILSIVIGVIVSGAYWYYSGLLPWRRSEQPARLPWLDGLVLFGMLSTAGMVLILGGLKQAMNFEPGTMQVLGFLLASMIPGGLLLFLGEVRRRRIDQR